MNINRYDHAELRCIKCNKKDNDLQGVMIAHDKGRYVTYEDFKELDTLCKKLMKQHSDISCENIKLRKAGDVLLLALWLGCDEYSRFEKEKAEENWDYAKEGKLSK